MHGRAVACPQPTATCLRSVHLISRCGDSFPSRGSHGVLHSPAMHTEHTITVHRARATAARKAPNAKQKERTKRNAPKRERKAAPPVADAAACSSNEAQSPACFAGWTTMPNCGWVVQAASSVRFVGAGGRGRCPRLLTSAAPVGFWFFSPRRKEHPPGWSSLLSPNPGGMQHISKLLSARYRAVERLTSTG